MISTLCARSAVGRIIAPSLATTVALFGIIVEAILGMAETIGESLREWGVCCRKAGWPQPKEYDDWREMLQKEDLEAVIIAVPLWAHADITVGCLDAGKHVLCEKMMAKTEADCPEPISPYAVSKLEGEHLLDAFAAARGLASVALRFFNVYGPRQPADSDYAAAVPIFLQRGLRGETLTVYGDGRQTRDFIFVEDVADCVFRAAAAPATGVFNVGSVTWVPNDVVLELPKGFKAFNAQRGMTDVGFEVVDGVGARLKGTFTPGQHDLSARFQVPKGTDESATFRMGTLPRVAELRVIAEASSQMRLEVDGFEQPQVAANQGKRVLVTRKLLERGDELEKGFTITLSGLPVPGYGRWIAVLLALGLGGIGIAAARGVLELGKESSKTADLKNAREVLLGELVEVERSRERGDLGPRAYADARRVLLNALARLGPDVLEVSTARKKRRRAAA